MKLLFKTLKTINKQKTLNILSENLVGELGSGGERY